MTSVHVDQTRNTKNVAKTKNRLMCHDKEFEDLFTYTCTGWVAAVNKYKISLNKTN